MEAMGSITVKPAFLIMSSVSLCVGVYEYVFMIEAMFMSLSLRLFSMVSTILFVLPYIEP